jgi:hypothetical protein
MLNILPAVLLLLRESHNFVNNYYSAAIRNGTLYRPTFRYIDYVYITVTFPSLLSMTWGRNGTLDFEFGP